MNVIGYSDRLSVRAGERVEFLVSCTVPFYDVEIVRLDHALSFPKAQQMAETIVPSRVSGTRIGRVQRINVGSAGYVSHAGSLESPGGVTFAAWVMPTLPVRGREQGIAAKWASASTTGYALLIDGEGRLHGQHTGTGRQRTSDFRSDGVDIIVFWTFFAEQGIGFVVSNAE